MKRRDFLKLVASIPALAALTKLPIVEAPPTPPKQVIEGHSGSMVINDGHSEAVIDLDAQADAFVRVHADCEEAVNSLRPVIEALQELQDLTLPKFYVPAGSRVMFTTTEEFAEASSYADLYLSKYPVYTTIEAIVTITDPEEVWRSYKRLERIAWCKCLLVIPYPPLYFLYLEAWPTASSMGEDFLEVSFVAKRVVLQEEGDCYGA